MKTLNGTKIGNVVNIIIDGNALQKTFETQEEANNFFRLMHKARTGDDAAYEEILVLINRRHKIVIKDILEKDTSDKYYLKGIDIAMPDILGTTFLEYLENDLPIKALVNFWKLLVANPDTRVREDLFKFLNTFAFVITDNGYFIAYKAVETKEKAEDDLAAFVSNQYLKIKKWKKNPANYEVVRFVTVEEIEVENPDYYENEEEYDDEGELIDTDTSNEPEFIKKQKKVYTHRLVLKGVDYNEDYGFAETNYGSLDSLFKNIDQLVDKRSVYQSRHKDKNGNKVEQVIGVPVKMDRANTDLDPKVECSTGLHVGSTKYVQQFSNADDTILLVLVNPAHVVAVPDHDNSKLRTCEYFPYAVLDRLENDQFEVLEELPYFEEDYMKYEMDDLEKEIQRINKEIETKNNPEKLTLDYRKILQDRLIVLEGVLLK